MGIIDKIFSGQEEGNAQGGASGDFRRRFSNIYTLPDAAQMQLRSEFLHTVGSQLGQGQIVPLPNDNRVEWRGYVYNLPLRLVVDADDAEGSLKWQNAHGTVDLDYSPEYINQPSPEAWSESDTQRLFVGKGVCIETFAWSMPDEIMGFRALPWEPMYYVIQAMQRDRARHLYIRDDEIEFDFHDDIGEMSDPVGQVMRFAQLIAWAAASWTAAPPDPRVQAARQAAEGTQGVNFPGAPITVTCGYCRALYLLGADGACPNCGAPARR